MGYRSFTLDENSHDLKDEESDEKDELQSSLESLEMMVLSDQDRVIVDATQVIEGCDGKQNVEANCDSCPLGCKIQILNFGKTFSPSVMELVSSSFRDKSVERMGERSEESSEDSDSDYGIVDNHVEELIELQESESEEEDYDNDSSESLTEIAAEGVRNSECGNNEEVIAGELGTSPRGYMDDYDIRVEATSEDQARNIQMFNVSMRRSWGHFGHGVESLGSDGEASNFSVETEDEVVPHPWSGCSSPTHPSPRLY